MISRLAIIAAGAVFLGGCDPVTLRGSVAGSCPVFERPPYAVKGATSYDQNVADGFVESGVAGCNWRRPAPRPASLDAQPGRRAKSPPVKKPGIIARAKARVWPSHVVAPVNPVPTAPAVVAPFEPERRTPPPVAPRDPVDELLQPSGK